MHHCLFYVGPVLHWILRARRDGINIINEQDVDFSGNSHVRY